MVQVEKVRGLPIVDGILPIVSLQSIRRWYLDILLVDQIGPFTTMICIGFEAASVNHYPHFLFQTFAVKRAVRRDTNAFFAAKVENLCQVLINVMGIVIPRAYATRQVCPLCFTIASNTVVASELVPQQS